MESNTFEIIVEAINRYIETARVTFGIDTKGHLVALKYVVPNDSFPAYKTFIYEMHNVSKDSTEKVFSYSETALYVEGKTSINEIEECAMAAVVGFIMSERLNEIIYGSTKEDE